MIQGKWNDQSKFKNIEHRSSEEGSFFDGYSKWFESTDHILQNKKDFSISFRVAPIGYCGDKDGIFSIFDRKKKEGIYIAVKKFGIVQIGLGNGKEILEWESINSALETETTNMITVVYQGTAGWCDLYINEVLANRKQFQRHTNFIMPEGTIYIGKHVDGEYYKKDTKEGAFYGYMKDPWIHQYAMNCEEVKEFHSQNQYGKKLEPFVFDRSIFQLDVQRPKYHMIAPGKWMNEPHAPFFYKGYYHLFYQANPHAPIWNNIQWGHMISNDMVHWKDLPLALEVENNQLDPDGCWSGSSCINKEGIPTIFYTAGNNSKFPNQSIAMAVPVLDNENELLKWKKTAQPILEQDCGWMGEFRDPFVWMEEETYFMLVGTGDSNNGGGNALLYSSMDLKNWESHGFFVDYDYEINKEVGHVWELPVLLPLKNTTTNCFEEESASHILLLCACQIEEEVVETYYFLGNWDFHKKEFYKFHEKAMLLDLGNGTFTGPSGFVTPDGRSVVFSIAQGKRDSLDEFYSGWAHNGGLPIELSIANKQLAIAPIKEIYQLKSNLLLQLQNVSIQQVNNALEKISGNSFSICLEIEGDYIGIATRSREHVSEVFFDREKSKFGIKDSKGMEIGKYRGDVDNVIISEDFIKMEYFLDHSMIEVYLNNKKSITTRHYSSENVRNILLTGENITVKNIELWEMLSIL